MASSSGGSVRKMKSRDLWEGRYWLEGKRRSVYAPSRKECQAKLRRALDNADQGIKPTPQRLTVSEYLDTWLETSVAARCRPSTAASYSDTVRLYVKPAIGRVALAKLEPADVRRMLAGLPDRLSPTTKRYVYVVLRNALGRALKEQLVHRNVATLIDPPSKARHEMKPLSAEQARTFLASIAGDPENEVPPDRLEALYVLALTSGMRQGEMLGLKWSDIDLEAGRLTVSHTLSRRTHELGEPKTKRARRTLHLSTLALEALKRHRTAQLEQRLKAGRKWIDNDFVFATRYGTPIEARNVSRSFARAIEAAGLPHQRFHDLRHASASIGLERGESLVEVSHRLGHANLSTTGDVYSHISPSMQERSAARMNEALTG